MRPAIQLVNNFFSIRFNNLIIPTSYLLTHLCPASIYLAMNGMLANSEDPDRGIDQGLHCLH